MLNGQELRIAGILLILSGWFLMLAAFVMLSALPQRTAFGLAGLGVEILGLALLARTHTPARKSRNE